jgi:hypothetical protein
LLILGSLTSYNIMTSYKNNKENVKILIPYL